MLSSVISLLFTSLLASVANAGIDGWHMDYVYTVANEMLDPIVNPNGQSAHMHKIVGGSAIHAAYSSDVYKGARCSSSNVKADKSNYWMPNLYWINDPAHPDTTTFIAISALVRFYYFLPRTSNDVPVEPFPEGLRMIVGDPNSKTDDKRGIFQFGCQQQANFANTIYGPNFNFDSYCPWGVKTEVRFPQCWDGVNLYKSDMSHMSYPVGWERNGDVRNGPCPATHPVRVPTILLEYTWHPEDVAPNQKVKGHLAWANGDTTGAGIHADFIAGWDTNLLRKALNDPGCVNQGSSMPFEKCPTFTPYHDINAAKSCNVPDKGILKQPSGNADKITIPALPGCNKIWPSGAKPTCNPPVAGLSVAGLTGTNGPLQVPAAQQRAFKLPTGKGWQYAGCFADDDTNPTFSGKITFNDPAMTLDLCTSTCAGNGMNFAALELRGGNRCTCAKQNTLNLGAGLYNISQCSVPCPGNSKQICGDNYRMAVYYTTDTSASGTGATPRSDGFLGCYADTTAAPALTDYFVQSNSMTIEKCTQTCKERGFVLAGAEYSTQCKCGNVYKGAQLLPPASCDMTCKGNTSQICGGSYKMSMYNTTNVVLPKTRKRAYPYPVV